MKLNFKPTEKQADIILNLAGLVFIGLVLALPFYLAVTYHDASGDIADIAKVYIPWFVMLVFVIVFHEQVRELIISIATAFRRGFKWGGKDGGIEIGTNQGRADIAHTIGGHITDEELADIKQAFANETDYAWKYFLRYINTTIYGTQFRMLVRASEKGSVSIDEAIDFYIDFLGKSEKKSDEYPTKDWTDYMIENQLIVIDKDNKSYNLGRHGKYFLDSVKAAGIDASKYLY